jgi:hypothetical protein
MPYRLHTVLTDNGIQFTDLPQNRHGWTTRYRVHRFAQICRANDIEHRLTKPNHPWTNGQVERMNRTIKKATVNRYHYETHYQLRQHMADFVTADNLGRRLKISNPIHQSPAHQQLKQELGLAAAAASTRRTPIHGRTARRGHHLRDVRRQRQRHRRLQRLGQRCDRLSMRVNCAHQLVLQLTSVEGLLTGEILESYVAGGNTTILSVDQAAKQVALSQKLQTPVESGVTQRRRGAGVVRYRRDGGCRPKHCETAADAIHVSGAR